MGRDRAGNPLVERNIVSAVRDVEAALQRKRHSTRRAALGRDPRGFLAAARAFRPHAIFNLCESVGGKEYLEKNAVALFEMIGIPFTGNGVLPLGICQRKGLTKRILRTAGIPTPQFAVVPPGARSPRWLDLPAIVKPAWTDGSLGITARSVVRNDDALRRRIGYVHRRFAQPALVERFIAGRELQVALVGNIRPFVLAIAELSYEGLADRNPKICTYAAKWIRGSAYYKYTNPVLPAPVGRALERRVREIAAEVFRVFELRGYARVDFRVEDDVPYVIDVNPNPDISADAGMAKAARHAGMSYADLIDRIVRIALE